MYEPLFYISSLGLYIALLFDGVQYDFLIIVCSRKLLLQPLSPTRLDDHRNLDVCITVEREGEYRPHLCGDQRGEVFTHCLCQ